ncbi:hypothetical protein [Algibacter lectus]|uniref:Uncharacterized protein n=1 Tax=Algibacter lectus TaxID=221126 RepID=A0A090X6G8_9FLAO|nr:hypothetical protein [Algibacter lectus]MDO7136960.1 hypothetical protein [Algibacter lectus]MWW24565.1 hypothetical protein [Algibacter lectus]TDY62585.1 hypothetical protein DFQ06_2429 [Algibacter lectus]SFC97471.1 hypothetical protein SAMN04489722_104197 [Algibacter lectus]GAL62120.1 hypothetical protein JCM19300_2871 [Algibacter lectus]
MKKLQLLSVAAMLLFSVNINADTVKTNLNLFNPDVRKCLIEASESEGWKLEAVYTDEQDKLVMVFGKGTETKTYIDK